MPDHAVDGASLVAGADLVVSAGGTMNREAAVLGTPVYTALAARLGGVDERLVARGPAAAAQPGVRPRPRAQAGGRRASACGAIPAQLVDLGASGLGAWNTGWPGANAPGRLVLDCG